MVENYFKELDYNLLDKKKVYRGKRITVEELTYYNNRDKKKVHREHVLAGDAAIVLAIDENEDPWDEIEEQVKDEDISNIDNEVNEEYINTEDTIN